MNHLYSFHIQCIFMDVLSTLNSADEVYSPLLLCGETSLSHHILCHLHRTDCETSASGFSSLNYFSSCTQTHTCPRWWWVRRLCCLELWFAVKYLHRHSNNILLAGIQSQRHNVKNTHFGIVKLFYDMIKKRLWASNPHKHGNKIYWPVFPWWLHHKPSLQTNIQTASTLTLVFTSIYISWVHMLLILTIVSPHFSEGQIRYRHKISFFL